ANCVQTDAGDRSIRLETSVGTYDPLPYVVPGFATLLVSTNATASLRAARLAGAALALVLLALGASTGGGFWSRLGLFAALTPGVLFVLGSVGANSLEIAGACALSQALFRLCATGVATRRIGIAVAVGGFATVASRPTSVAWLVAAAGVAAILHGRPRELVTLPGARVVGAAWFTGFALQGRHVMALAVMAPILAGTVMDARGAPASRRLRWACAGVWAVTQVAYWLFNAHRNAVGTSGTWSFLDDQPAWLPGPWELWLAVIGAGAVVAACALALSPVAVRSESARSWEKPA
ncbi:MAG: hypothetical protein QOD65_3727, partial [Gaiellales bacterium]|nr:hypothetical protein [Gaiellales bacterium]